MITGAIIVGGCFNARGGEPSPAPKPDPDRAAQIAKVDELIQKAMDRRCSPGLSLAVVRDGELVMAKGYGMANLEWQAPATPETVYQIQSMTKSFTATGIMLLVEEGKIGLDDKISTYLEGTPEAWQEITVRHLLTHTSGIKDFLNEPTASLRLDVSESDVLNATAPRPLNFKPGERYSYSNTNFHLLAMIIHKVTGKFYGDFLRERIFDPLAMTDTRVISLDEIIPRRASGYMLGAGGWHNGMFIAESLLAYGGGGLRSTVLDMVKWDAALNSERVLKKSTLDQMWTPAVLNNGTTTAYGFGWFLEAVNGHRCIGHGGANSTGFETDISRFVDDRITVIVFANCYPVGVHRLARQVAGVFVPEIAPAEMKIKPIEDKEPQVTARIRRNLNSWPKGEFDPKEVSPEIAQLLKREEARKYLQSFGSLQNLELVEHGVADGKWHWYKYLATYPQQQFIIAITLSKEDVIVNFDHEKY